MPDAEDEGVGGGVMVPVNDALTLTLLDEEAVFEADTVVLTEEEREMLRLCVTEAEIVVDVL